jgi:hypothetical protein
LLSFIIDEKFYFLENIRPRVWLSHTAKLYNMPLRLIKLESKSPMWTRRSFNEQKNHTTEWAKIPALAASAVISLAKV